MHPKLAFTGFIDDLYADGEAEYSIEFAGEKEEEWTVLHTGGEPVYPLEGLKFPGGRESPCVLRGLWRGIHRRP